MDPCCRWEGGGEEFELRMGSDDPASNNVRLYTNFKSMKAFYLYLFSESVQGVKKILPELGFFIGQ